MSPKKTGPFECLSCVEQIGRSNVLKAPISRTLWPLTCSSCAHVKKNLADTDTISLFTVEKAFFLPDLGIFENGSMRSSVGNPILESKQRETILQRLDRQEIALIRQIDLLDTWGALDGTQYKMEEKIRLIYQAYSSSHLRIPPLLALRREIYLRTPQIEKAVTNWMRRIRRNGDTSAAITMYDVGGFEQKALLESFDSTTGLVSVRLSGKSVTMPAGDLFSELPVSEARRLGFAKPEDWDYGRLVAYPKAILWKKVGERLEQDGKITLIRSDQPVPMDTKFDFLGDIRFETEASPLLRELGFEYDSASGIQGIPEIDFVNVRLAKTPIHGRRLIQFNHRKSVPGILFARALIKNFIPFGIEGVLRHDYSYHLLERLALPEVVFKAIKSQLEFLLSLYDHPVLKKNPAFQNVIAEIIEMVTTNYDNLVLTKFLFGRTYREKIPSWKEGVDSVSDSLVSDFAISAATFGEALIQGFAVHSRGRRFYATEFLGTSFKSRGPEYNWSSPREIEFSDVEFSVLSDLVAQASKKTFTKEQVMSALNDPQFIRTFVSPLFEDAHRFSRR